MTGIVVPHHRACLPLARIGDLNGQTWLEPYLAGATLRRILQPGDKSDGKLWYAWCGEAPASTVNQHQRGIEDDSLPSSKAELSEPCLFCHILRNLFCRAGHCGREATRHSRSAVVADHPLKNFSDD